MWRPVALPGCSTRDHTLGTKQTSTKIHYYITCGRLNKAGPLFSTPSACSSVSVSTSLNHPRLANHRGPRMCSEPMGCELTERRSGTEAPTQNRWAAGLSHPITACPAARVRRQSQNTPTVFIPAIHLEALLGKLGKPARNKACGDNARVDIHAHRTSVSCGTA